MTLPTGLAVGSVFAGYEIVDIAGQGGMGVVYRARNVILGKERALKVVSPEYSADVVFRERFKRESQLAASIEHPNVVPIYHASEENGLLYVVMEYVDGWDLAALLRHDGRMEPERALALMGQVAAALDVAHEHGLVHRDVKPANVLVTRRDAREHAYLTDFGLAKRLASNTGLTMPGAFVGTYQYAAPEQFKGDDLDGRADVYALGCVLFQALAGRPPFERDSIEALVGAHLFIDPPRISEVCPALPAELDEVMSRALAKEPANRFTTTGEFLRASSQALQGATARTRVRPPPQSENAAVAPRSRGIPELPHVSPRKRKKRLRRWMFGAGSAATVALIAAVLIGGLVGGSPPSRAGETVTTLQLTADPTGQLRFDKDRLTAPAGNLRITLKNPSPVPHNISIAGPGGLDPEGPTVTTGHISQVETTLKPGTYTYYCSVPGHRQAGMQGKLTVR